jgi:hypothetical protein
MRLPFRRKPVERDHPIISMDEWMSYFTYLGHQYPLGFAQTQQGNALEAPKNFAGYVQQAYKANGIVFACMLARQLHFSEARFAFREIDRQSGRPGDLVADSGQLALLRRPWNGGTTGDLLNRMIQDADLQGDAFILRGNRRLVRLRPDWVSVLWGSSEDVWDIDAELVGYLFHPGGPRSGRDPIPLLAEEVAHFMPVPDPLSPGRGMSWLTPVVREILADLGATEHKQRFFENAATPNLAVTFPDNVGPDEFERWVKLFEAEHQGVMNAYKTLFLVGAKPEVIGANFRQMDFKVTQGAGETRIAAAAGVPPVIVGLSEGLQSATYSNYGQARRRFADGTMRPLWRNAAGSLARIVNVKPGTELWYDDRDIPFLAEDLKDNAEIQKSQSVAIEALVRAGFDPQTVVSAVTAGDLSRLKHSGLVSVQLLPPGTKSAGNGQPEPALSEEEA